MAQTVFGAGIWHFATYVDRYATDGYGAPVTLLDSIDRAGSVGDLTYVDLTYSLTDPGLTMPDVRGALDRNDLKVIGITPEIYTRVFRLDFRAMQRAQDQHDALTALRFAQQALFSARSPGD